MEDRFLFLFCSQHVSLSSALSPPLFSPPSTSWRLGYPRLDSNDDSNDHRFTIKQFHTAQQPKPPIKTPQQFHAHACCQNPCTHHGCLISFSFCVLLQASNQFLQQRNAFFLHHTCTAVSLSLSSSLNEFIAQQQQTACHITIGHSLPSPSLFSSTFSAFSSSLCAPFSHPFSYALFDISL